MIRQGIFVSAFIAHAFLGSVCMVIPMAIGMPMHGMDAIVPMTFDSHADCTLCTHHEQQKGPAQQSSCADDCLSNAYTMHLANVLTAAHQLIVAVPPDVSVVLGNVQEDFLTPHITVSPPPIETSTVVLTL